MSYCACCGQLLKRCMHCGKRAEFYANVRGRCKECHKKEMKELRAVKGFIYNETARAKRAKLREVRQQYGRR